MISVVATIFGLATSLGLGVQQINAGFLYLFGWPISSTIQVVLVIAITILASMSLIFGLDKGIKLVSVLNMRLAIVLLLFVLIVGPTVYLLKSYFLNTGNYLLSLIETSSYINFTDEDSWQKSWTIFYWAWWISWAPFVGIFIARISKGRTFKEFILGVLLVPTLFTFLWLTVFGGSAIFQEYLGNHAITDAVNNNISTSIYYLLEQYPLPIISSALTMILVAGFFITSSDSGSYVVDTLTSGGRHDASTGQKLFWASIEGLIAIVLLLSGGLVALQTASLLTALPFGVILIMMCFSFYKALREDKSTDP